MKNDKKASSKENAKRIRAEVARINCLTKDSHIGGGYSSADILSVLYTRILGLNKGNLNDPNRNIFILSKGHIATTMYATLENAGIISKTELEKHLMNGGKYAGHTRKYQTNGVLGIEMSAGSLGHGSCVGCGMAYAKKNRGLAGNVYVLLGDGECNEGSVWESAMLASRYKLSNLILIVDRNHLQAYGRDEQVLNMGDLEDKFRSFGFHAITIDGHNHDLIEKTLLEAPQNEAGKPTAVIAETVKGKGVSFMENKLEWHFKSPNEDELRIIEEELAR